MKVNLVMSILCESSCPQLKKKVDVKKCSGAISNYLGPCLMLWLCRRYTLLMRLWKAKGNTWSTSDKHPPGYVI